MNLKCIALKKNIKITLNDQDYANINTIFEIPVKNKNKNMLIECSIHNCLCNKCLGENYNNQYLKFEGSDVKFILMSHPQLENYKKVQFEVSCEDYQNKFIKLCSDLFQIIDHEKTKLSTDPSS
jgi:hypothetical protein